MSDTQSCVRTDTPDVRVEEVTMGGHRTQTCALGQDVNGCDPELLHDASSVHDIVHSKQTHARMKYPEILASPHKCSCARDESAPSSQREQRCSAHSNLPEYLPGRNCCDDIRTPDSPVRSRCDAPPHGAGFNEIPLMDRPVKGSCGLHLIANTRKAFR